MKKLWILLLLPAFLACSTAEKDITRVELVIENAGIEEAELGYTTDFILRSRENLTAAEQEGRFVFEIKLDKPVMATITAGSQRMNVYLEPGKDLTVVFDMEDVSGSLKFEGALASENQLLRTYAQDIEPAFGRQVVFEKFREAQPEEFAAFAMEMKETSLSFLHDFAGENPLSASFEKYFETDIRYQAYANMLNYPMYHAHYNQLAEAPQMPEGYYEFTKDALDISEEQLQVPSCVNFVSAYSQYYMTQHGKDMPEDLSYPDRMMWAAENAFEGKARAFAVASAITIQFNHGDFSRAVEASEAFKAENSWQYLNDVLTTSHSNALRVAPGSEAPDFTLVDINGEEVSLSDFRDKVVYLDFWASWCGPCMREVPHAKELKKRFEGEENLVFLYVSVDEDEQAWRRTVEQHNIQGVHLNVPGMRHEIAQSYNVQGVPSFFIIDKDGVIHNNNPSRPSGSTIDEELRAIL